jgi:phosphoglucosamine mutase
VKQRIDPAATPSIQDAVRRVEDALAGSGRVVLRASGTEPVIRVMVEGREAEIASRYANELAETVRTAV